MQHAGRCLVPLVALGALALDASPQQGSRANPCLSGPAAGAWELPPPGSGGSGFLAGLLSSVDGSEVLYLFQATLVDVVSPCLSCIEGDIDGTLDDGRGAGPDFLVKGRYLGSFYGLGAYEARVLRPGSATPIGVIRGRFADELDETDAGRFGGRFRLCR